MIIAKKKHVFLKVVTKSEYLPRTPTVTRIGFGPGKNNILRNFTTSLRRKRVKFKRVILFSSSDGKNGIMFKYKIIKRECLFSELLRTQRHQSGLKEFCKIKGKERKKERKAIK